MNALLRRTALALGYPLSSPLWTHQVDGRRYKLMVNVIRSKQRPQDAIGQRFKDAAFSLPLPLSLSGPTPLARRLSQLVKGPRSSQTFVSLNSRLGSSEAEEEEKVLEAHNLGIG